MISIICKQNPFVPLPTQASWSSSSQPSLHSSHSWFVAPVQVLQDVSHSVEDESWYEITTGSYPCVYMKWNEASLLVQPVSVVKHTCTQRESVVPHFVEVAVDAVEAELPFVTVVTAALPVSSASPVAIAHPVPMTRSVRAPHTGFK